MALGKKTKKKTTKKATSSTGAKKKRSRTQLALPDANPTEVAQKRVVAEVVEEPSRGLVTTPNALPALSDGLNFYLEAIKRYPLLSREEELRIAQRYYEKKDPKDAEILVTANLRFVVKVAAEYSQFGSRLIDLIQEGNVGLMHAVSEFNPYKGARLITYAVWWIRGYIQDYLMKQHSLVKIGTTHNQRKLFYNLEREKARLDQMGLEPTVRLLSDRLGVPEKDVQLMTERLSGKDLSLDQPVGEEGSSSRLDFETEETLDITDQLIERESLEQLTSALDKIRGQLNEKETYILESRLLSDQPLTLQDIGEQWGVTREAVRQMEARVLKKIKQELLPESSEHS